MSKRIMQIPNFQEKLLHGGDYNPEQWLDCPEIIEEDIRLMKKAGINCVSVGIFAWAKLEKEEGKYDFDWLEEVIQRLFENGIYTILATPTGAIPPWLSAVHEEVLQVNEYGVRNYAGDRHNFCPSSPIMRKKMKEMNARLAEKFGAHPGVIAWHISNEYGGNGREAACHCMHCQKAFREWLKQRYGTIERLNKEWWTAFWSHTYTDWEQIHSPSVIGENVLHGLKLDWRRFVSWQLLEFAKEEIAVIRKYSAYPVTTNMMGFFKPLNYFEWEKELDVIAWDNYPYWHSEENELGIAAEAAAGHILMRSLKKQPFLMMESTPSVINWRPVNTLKRPGMHELSSIQAIACGSNSVQYFQWRKSRGSCEKYHGAVLDHRNSSSSRVFADVCRVGTRLQQMSKAVSGTYNDAKIALIFDWENWWAIEDAWAVQNKLDYKELFCRYFRPLWEMGIEVDIQDMTCDLNSYQIVIAPYNYMYRGDYADRIRTFVKNGGCYVTTCWSGETNESDLCFTERHPLQDVLGICPEEIDACNEYWKNQIRYEGKTYDVTGLRALVHAETAEVLSVYEEDFYKGYPALTKNNYGKGSAYYIASENEADFLKHFYQNILLQAGIQCEFQASMPEGVVVSGRSGCGKRIWFLQNFNRTEAKVMLKRPYLEVEKGKYLNGILEMKSFSCYILEEETNL